MKNLKQMFQSLSVRGNPGMTIVAEEKRQLSDQEILKGNLSDWASNHACLTHFHPWLEGLIDVAEQQADAAVGSIQGAVMTGEKQAYKRVLRNFNQWAGKGKRLPPTGE